jgi:hypothetical protein
MGRGTRPNPLLVQKTDGSGPGANPLFSWAAFYALENRSNSRARLGKDESGKSSGPSQPPRRVPAAAASPCVPVKGTG